MQYQWNDLKDPKKYDLKMILKLTPMLDFLREGFHPISEITREAIRRGIIMEDEKDLLFVSFKRVDNRIDLFEFKFYPRDQSPTGNARYEYRLKDLTPDDFWICIEQYNNKHFKSQL